MEIKVDQIGIAHEDDRRAITAVFNGDFDAKQIKILAIKKHSILGNHYHNYREMFYVLEGQAVYVLEGIKTKEQRIISLRKGDRLVIDSEIAHKAEMQAGTITLEATEHPYISAEKNDVRYEIG